MPLGIRRDEHGQAPSRLIRARQVADRSIDELIGLCKGVAADGRVCQEEAEYLFDWLRANDHIRGTWPADIIRVRLVEYLEDGRLDQDEKDDLFELMKQVTGKPDRLVGVNFATALPFDAPLPDIEIAGQRFCLTGRFAFGNRADCEHEILSLDGEVVQQPVKSGCVVVVGLLGSRDWAHSTHGRKIEAAVGMRRKGCPVCIVPEDHWTLHLARELGVE